MDDHDRHNPQSMQEEHSLMRLDHATFSASLHMIQPELYPNALELCE